MNTENSIHFIAKKYARAFLGIYAKDLSYESNQKLSNIRAKLMDHQDLLFLLSQAYNNSHNHNKNTIIDWCSALSIPHYFYTLIEILTKEHRLILLPYIFEWIVYYYNKDNNHMDIVITSSQSLTEDEKNIIEKFIKEKTQKILHSTYITDAFIIAGIRIQSSTFLWEYSIAKFLRDIKTHAAYIR